MTRFDLRSLTAAVSVLLALTAGCERQPAPLPAPPPGAPPVLSQVQSVSDLVQLAAAEAPPAANEPNADAEAPKAKNPRRLAFTPPASWPRLGPSAAAGATATAVQRFTVPRAAGDVRDGEFVVRRPPDAAASVDAALDRWRRQFASAGGQPLADGAVRCEALEVGELKVTLVEIRGGAVPGSPSAGGPGAGGGAPGVPGPAAPGGNSPGPASQVLLAAIVAAPDGLWTFEFGGPETTVASHRDAFLALVRELRTE
jgi:hypothetical protein